MYEQRPRAGIEFIVAIAGAIIALLLFLPEIPSNWKILLIAILIIEAVLLIVGTPKIISKLSWSSQQRARQAAIRKHPELITELYRFERRIFKVLYERQEGYPSLVMVAGYIMSQIRPSEVESEFKQKIDMLRPIYDNLNIRLQNYRGGKYRWTSVDFCSFVDEIDVHLSVVVNSVFNTIYTGVQKRTLDAMMTTGVARQWDSFSKEFNGILQDWRPFTARVTGVTRYGSESRVKMAELLV